MHAGALALAVVGVARADGGAPVASVKERGRTLTLLVRPAEPRAGPVEFTLLGEAPEGWVLSLRGPDEAAPSVVAWSSLRPAAREARVELERPGSWSVQVGPAAAEPALQAQVEVGAPSPAWSDRWPWLAAWVPIAVLVACRNAAVTYTARRTRA